MKKESYIGRGNNKDVFKVGRELIKNRLHEITTIYENMSYISELIAIAGQSGTGKSASLENMNPKTTFLINVSSKPLPFRGWMTKYKPLNMATEEGKTGNYAPTNDWQVILNLMKYVNESRPEITDLIIDDFQYLMADEFMKRAYEKGWDKFTEMGRHIYDILDLGRRLRGTLKVYVLTHDEIVKQGVNERRKMKTIGNLLDDKITLEGMFTYVLFTHVERVAGKDEGNYSFLTQTDGYTTAKSPKGCMPYKIPNDLTLVSKAIDDYKK